MLAVLLLILKIIGIILLVLVLFLLFLVLAVLFVPIRYRINAILKQERQAKAKISISWFLHFLSIQYIYGNDESNQGLLIRVAGIKLGKGKSEKKENEEKAKTEDADSSKLAVLQQKENIQNISEAANTEKIHQLEADETAFRKTASQNTKKKAKATKKKTDTANSAETDNSRSKKMDRIKKIWHEWKSDPMQQSVSRLKRELIVIIIHILPRRGKIDLQVGFDDPSVTGQLLAVLAILYPRFKGNLNVTPYFDQSILAGEVDCSGRIRLIFPTAILIRAWRDRALRSFIKNIRK